MYQDSKDRNKGLSHGMRHVLALMFVTTLVFGLAPSRSIPRALAATTVVVSPATPNGWIFDGDGSTGGVGSFVAGPAPAPLGAGSAQFVLTTASSGKILALPGNAGLNLSAISALTYSTYRSSADAGNNLAVTLQLNVDYDPNDAATGWQGRLVFEPYHDGNSGTIVQNTWQTWNALTEGANWSASPGPGAAVCPMSSPCTWDEVLDAFPNARIHPNPLLGAIMFKAGSNWAGFNGNVDAFTLGINGAETTYDFEPEPQCANDCYVDGTNGNDTFGGASPERAKKTIQAALNQVSPNGVVHVAAGTYAEAVSITKNGITLQGAGAGENAAEHTIIDGPVSSSAGIRLPSGGTTGVTIKNLRVQEFTGGGICSSGASSNNLTIDAVDVVRNIGAGSCPGGIYINGLVDGVTIDNALVDSNTPRGIVIWNGFKQHITITNNTVSNNSCCGIELQDGTASGVTITGNSVQGNADSGIGLVGLTGGAGANLVANNTVTNNGRFGIEVKLPNGTGAETGDGSIVVRDNIVERTTPIEVQRPSEIRDLGGIVVIRRGFVPGNNNVDIPNGVVVKNNTVRGYQQTNTTSVSEGFGIVVEGRKMSVVGNTVSGNDVGIQRQAGHGPYTANTNTDGDQSNANDLYFGRGNSPVTCAVIGANTLSGNTVPTRDVSAACDIMSRLAFSIQPGSAEVGAPLNPQPVVAVLAEDGTLFTGYNGPLTIALGANPGKATLNGTATVNAVNGIVTFTDLSIPNVGLGYTLVAAAGELAPATSAPFEITSGPTAKLLISTQPGGAEVGTLLNPQPVVIVQDANGNTVTSYNGPVTVTLEAKTGAATLNGTTTVNAVNGVATFTDLSIDTAGVGYTLVATVGELTPASSMPFTISEPAPEQFKLYVPMANS